MAKLYRGVLVVYFPDESLLARCHNKVQKGERLEVYTERKKILYMAAGIARWPLYNYDVLKFKELLLRHVQPELRLAAQGIDAQPPLS